jgi:hypothetical protein
MKRFLAILGIFAAVSVYAADEPGLIGRANNEYRFGNFLTNSASTNVIGTAWTAAGVPLISSNATALAFTGGNLAVKLFRGQKTLGFSACISSTATASTSNVVFNLATSIDGTNFSSSYITATVPEVGSGSSYIGYVQIPATSIGDARWVKLVSAYRSDTLTTNQTRVNWVRWSKFMP